MVNLVVSVVVSVVVGVVDSVVSSSSSQSLISCVTSKLLIIKNKLPCDNRISCRQILLLIVNKDQCNCSVCSVSTN